MASEPRSLSQNGSPGRIGGRRLGIEKRLLDFQESFVIRLKLLKHSFRPGHHERVE